ncbi:uncharacterized protein with NRDE domain [Pseudomonas fluvialis]|uniref:Uncharacterized protein with NRDE domain n=1 Tax=Pseudomonas fluvialis TaxID=1793966 RepID=A0A7X0ETC2_9PSED|nr:NRDE family protein [Pseudomonas fluvialis]MBB6340431.1 uncharacterized protein with NRDE domain [Pseudomonas fluvialis]
MCLIVFAWRPGHALPLLVAANRDEFYARPAAALAPWDDVPGLVAGRDLQAGGTWLGLGANGRFAALTNIRDPRQPLGSASRGELPARFLASTQSPAEFMAELQPQLHQFSGFNLLLGDGRQLWHLNPRETQPRQLGEGIYGLSNATLDTPWPKLLRARQGLQQALHDADDERLFAVLADPQPAADEHLPDTGVGRETERLLSSVFIRSATYGTRASTLVRIWEDGSRSIHERRFGPHGEPLGETRLELR